MGQNPVNMENKQKLPHIKKKVVAFSDKSKNLCNLSYFSYNILNFINIYWHYKVLLKNYTYSLF